MNEQLLFFSKCDQSFLNTQYEDLRNAIIYSSENLKKSKSYNLFLNNGMIKWCKVWEKYFFKPNQNEKNNTELFKPNNLRNDDVINLLSNIAMQVYQKEKRNE